MASHQKFNWKATLAVLIIAITGLLVFTYWPRDPVKEKVDLVNITVSVEYLNGTVETETGLDLNGTDGSVFTVMDAFFTIGYQEYPNGYFINKINGQFGGYTYTVNANTTNLAANDYILTNNSIVNWTQVS